MGKTDLARFMVEMAPHLMSLGNSLYDRFGGDQREAIKAITLIHDHGSSMYQAFDDAQEELDRLKSEADKAGGKL